MNILYRGLDVSSHQGTIDWVKVKNAGMKFCFIRLGFRGYGSTGSINLDKQFLNNIKGCIANNISIGLYFYSTAINETESIEESNFILKTLKDNNYESAITLPICYDFEGYNNKRYRTYGISKSQRTKNCIAFNKVITNAGYNTISYGSQGNIRTTYDLASIGNYVWCAKYAGGYKTVTCADKYFPSIGDFTKNVAIWQYTSIGNVDGIKGNVDLDNMYIDIIDNFTEVICLYNEPSKTLIYTKTSWLIVSNNVKWLQWMLVQAGYKLTIDGRYGKLTYNAFLDFQKNNNLTVDGKCGYYSKCKLKEVAGI